MRNSDSTEDITKLLNNWSNGDCTSGERLKAIIYYHAKGIAKNLLAEKRAIHSESNKLMADLSNTTSLLHEALIKLVPASETYENRQQFHDYLALFIRRMLCDEIKKDNALKRGQHLEHISLTEVLLAEKIDSFESLDYAFNKLQMVSKFGARLLHWRYFLGFSVDRIVDECGENKHDVYSELKTSKAFVRAQMEAY